LIWTGKKRTNNMTCHLTYGEGSGYTAKVITF